MFSNATFSGHPAVCVPRNVCTQLDHSLRPSQHTCDSPACAATGAMHVSLPEGTEVVFELPPTKNEQSTQDPLQDEIFEILSHRYASGHTDTAARHNEHQP